MFLPQIPQRRGWTPPCWTVTARGDRRGSPWRSSVWQTGAPQYRPGGLSTWRSMDRGRRGGERPGGRGKKSVICLCGGTYFSVWSLFIWVGDVPALWHSCRSDSESACDWSTNWCCDCFVSCLTVVNQCTVKAWIFLMPVQNAAKKKGIRPPSFCSSCSVPPPTLPPHLIAAGKDAAVHLLLNDDYIRTVRSLRESILISHNSA